MNFVFLCYMILQLYIALYSLLAKCLLYAINGGVDAKSRDQVGPMLRPITTEYLDYYEVIDKMYPLPIRELYGIGNQQRSYCNCKTCA